MSLIAAEMAIAVISPVPSRSPVAINDVDSGTGILIVPMVEETPVAIETQVAQEQVESISSLLSRFETGALPVLRKHQVERWHDKQGEQCPDTQAGRDHQTNLESTFSTRPRSDK